MPKAALYEYNGIVLRQDDVRSPRQTFLVQSVTEAPAVQPLPDDELRLRIGTTDAGHHPTSRHVVDYVGHPAIA